MGDIDRVNQLAQATQLINGFQRVQPADQRHSAKQDQRGKEEQGDKVELSKDEEEKPAEELELVEISDEEPDEPEHLDLAV
jgi:hypothetical protein